MNIKFLNLLILLVPFFANSQITVDLPFQRAVFQRNQAGTANINFAAYSTVLLQRADVRITNLMNNSVGPWSTLQNNPFNGTIIGTVNNLPGGWYKAEIRGLKIDNTFTAVSSVEKFGVGEVFVVAGQSNAMGLLNYGAVGATDDRVNVVNFNYECQQTDPPLPVFSQLSSTSNIATWGSGPWSYGRLGDLLATNLGVPVLFFNAAATGTSIENWYASMLGQSTNHLFLCSPYCSATGVPYGALSRVLKYYIPMLGIRAILWQQGEGDNYQSTCGPALPTAQMYRDKLRAIIDQSRVDASYNVPWVIARTSYNPISNDPFPANDHDITNDFGALPGTRSDVIVGQNMVISDPTTTQIYAGPFTDVIARDPTVDPIHFINNANTQGVTQLADAWYTALTTNNVLIAPPKSPSSLKQLNLFCLGGLLKGEAVGGFNNYTWVQDNNNISSPFNANNTSIDFDLTQNATYRVYIKESNGTTYLSNRIFLPQIFNSNIPTITMTPLFPNPGQSVTLTASNCNGKVSWIIDDLINNTQTQTPLSQHINPLIHTPTVNTTYTAQCEYLETCGYFSDAIKVCRNSESISLNFSGQTLKIEANQGISTTSKIQFNASTPTRVTYDAGKSITLQPGFEAQKGTIFNTQIDGCGNN